MRIPKECKLEKACDKQASRWAWNLVEVERDGETAVFRASNGKVLAEIEIPLEGESMPPKAMIPPAAIKATRNGRQEPLPLRIQSDRVVAGENGATQTFPVPSLEEARFPDVSKIWPEPPAVLPTTICINAKLLYDLAQALGAEDAQVKLTVQGPEIPVEVRALVAPVKGRGLIMPLMER